MKQNLYEVEVIKSESFGKEDETVFYVIAKNFNDALTLAKKESEHQIIGIYFVSDECFLEDKKRKNEKK